MFEFEQIKDVINSLLFACIAFIGGAVSYLSSTVTKKTKVVFKDMIIKSFASAFSGFIVGLVMIGCGYPLTTICAVTGVAGYIGSDLVIRLIQARITQTMNLTQNSKGK